MRPFGTDQSDAQAGCPGRKNGQPVGYVGSNAESESLGSVGKLEEYNWELR